MKVHRFWTLTLICCTIFTSSIADDPKIVCYYTNWSIYRPGNAKYSPQNINPYLCTHLIYAFGGFTKDNTLQPFDKYQDIEKGGYAKFTGLKTYNKNLKTLLAIGGWNEGSARFSPLVGSADRRREFVKNAIKYLRQNHFDGLDLDWEYPTFRDGGKSKDRANYAQFVQELSEEFDRESSKTGRPRLLLTLAIPAGVDKIDKGYDVIKLNQYLDWFNVLTYDYHDSFEPATNHHAPLYPLEEDNEYNYDSELNIDYSIKHLINAGADRQKLILGIPTYGRSYTLFNADATDIGAPTDGPGEPGDATREKGFLAYYEICQNIKSDDDWVVMHPNDIAMGPYSYKNDQWISYDDEKMARRKAKYVADNNLGGIMFWSIDTDDFRGTCSGKPYPLIEAAKEGLLDALGVKLNESKEAPRRTTTRNRNRPNTGQKNKSPSNFKDNFNRRRKPSPKTTIRPTQSSLIYNSKTTTPEPPTTPDPGSDFKCEDDGFFPHPRDCKKYFWCLDSGPSNLGIVAHQFTCPSGLVFNTQADSCDYSRNVACSKTNPTTVKPRPPITTNFKTTTKLSTTQRTTTFRTTTNPPTTTSTTPAYEEEEDEEYEYENENAEPERDIEDPKVIKELIDLIKKAGGLEELEKQLKFTEDHFPEVENSKTDKLSTTQSTFSKTLYDKFLKRKQLENRFVKTENTNKVKPDTILSNESIPKENSSRYSSVIRNSRPNSQHAGLEKLPEFEGFLKEKPQYVTIQRFRSTTSANVDKVNDNSQEIIDDSEEEYSIVEATTKSSAHPQYVNINRNRFKTQSAVVEEIERDKLGENPLLIESITIAPQYTTINRRRRPDIIETAPQLLETESTSQAPLSSSKYKPIIRTTTATPSDSTKIYDEELEIPTESGFPALLDSDTKYQNINRRTLLKTSVDTTVLPIKADEINIPQTTDLITNLYDQYSINSTQSDASPDTTDFNINNTDEQTTIVNQFIYNLTTSTTNISDNQIFTEQVFTIKSPPNETLNDISTNKNKISELEEAVTVENAPLLITTELSSPSPFEFQKQNNKRPLNEPSTTFRDSTTYPIEDRVTTNPLTTTNKPTVLHHIFAIEYDYAEGDSNVSVDLDETIKSDDENASREEISKRLEKLVEINRIVVIHSKQEKHKINNSTGFIVEKIPTTDKIGEISRWISVKLKDNYNRSHTNIPPKNSAHQMPTRSNLLDSKFIFDVETSTIPLEGLFDHNRILIEDHLNNNEVADYQIIKPPLEINTVPIHYHNQSLKFTNKTKLNPPMTTVINLDQTLLTKSSNDERTKFYQTDRNITFSSGNNTTKSSNPRHRFNIHNTNRGNTAARIKDIALHDFVVNRNNETTDSVKFQAVSERQINNKPSPLISEEILSTVRPFQNFKKKVVLPRVPPSTLRRKSSFTSSTTTTQSSTDLNISPQPTTPKIIVRRKFYSRPGGTTVSRPISETSTISSKIDSLPAFKRTRRPPSSINSKFVRPLRKNNNSIPQGNITTIIDDQFLSQTVTTNNKQPAIGLTRPSNYSFVDDEISDVLKAMSKTPLPVTINKSRQSTKNKTINRRPSKPETIQPTEEIAIKTTTEGRRKIFQKIQTKVDNENHPKILPKLLSNDYDYYDDNEPQIAGRDNSQVKVVLHETGAIECLDQGNFPHPLSCKKFISCAKIETGGVIGWEYTCPKGLNYDPVGGMCNWATGLGCKD